MKLGEDEINELLRKQNEMFFELEMKMVRENLGDAPKEQITVVAGIVAPEDKNIEEENFETF